jgi:hypothetical protein
MSAVDVDEKQTLPSMGIHLQEYSPDMEQFIFPRSPQKTNETEPRLVRDRIQPCLLSAMRPSP